MSSAHGDSVGPVEGAVRLVDSVDDGNSSTGIPQIFHDGAWGTICEAVSVLPYDYTDDITEVRRNPLYMLA